MKMNKKYVGSADRFFKALLKDPEVRIAYEEEKAKSEIAMAVRAARLRAHLTQAKLAEKVGTTQSVIARLESGSDKRIPTLPLLAQIAAACNGSLEVGFKFKQAV